jgi:hypothetical protein
MEQRRRTTSRVVVRVCAGVLVAAFAASCGAGQTPFGDPPKVDDSPDASGEAGEADVGVSPSLGNDAAGNDADSSGGCGNTLTDPHNCGACGNACGTGQSCVAGACACPPYQSLCNGACIATSVDPSNCGGCGVACVGAQVCSGGKCDSGCLPGLSVCSNACVDLANDNEHCGDCSTKCGAGKGCAKGHCVDAVPVGAAPSTCAGGGPPINVGPGGPAGCLGNIAQTTFDWSLCSCTDLAVSALLFTDAYNSATGPYKPGQLGGGVGVDRDVTLWSDTVTIGGTFWESGVGTYHSSGPTSEVKTDMHLGGSWSASSPFIVDGNASVAGTLSGVTVKGTNASVASVAPACDCSPSKIIPVGAIVAAHRPPNNDNLAIALSASVFESPSVGLRLDLPCGSYYLTKIAASNPVTIAVHGRTALFIDGDVAASDALAFVLDPSAELDIFIAGTLKASDSLVIGSPNYPALTRAYVGGTDTLRLSADVRLGGELYAASSQLVDWSAKNDIYGAVFAGNFKASAATRIHYDRGVLNAGGPCPPLGGPTDGGTPTCGSCKDCGNQACVQGACGSCTTSADCCAPLGCQNGKCLPIIQ